METQTATVYDNFAEDKWVFLIGGYKDFERGQSEFIPYLVYRGIISAFQFYLICMGLATAVVSYGDTMATVEGLHFVFLVTVSFLGLISRHINYTFLKTTMNIMRSGVYQYTDEKFGEEYVKIKAKYVKEIRTMNNVFQKLMIIGATTNTVMLPVVKFLMTGRDTTHKALNPFLPQPIYMPFNTRTVVGYIGGFIINIFFMFWFVPIVIGMDSIYISCTLQLKAQFEILNYSLCNLEQRAHFNLLQKNQTLKGASIEDLYSNLEFQKCLYGCLRANIQHHQALVKLKSVSQHYIGLIFLIVVALASVIMAAHVVLIMETPEIHVLVNFVVILLLEVMYTFHYCWYGEELISEGTKVYYSLYSTPWYKCGLRFKKLLSIIIPNTRVPIQNKTAGFDISASLDTFGSIISTMYQLMNVVRNSKS